MEKINFYEVKVGIMSRKGNMDVKHSFVCKSNQSEYKVRDYYQLKYKGFDVSTNPVETIEEPEIIKDFKDEDDKILEHLSTIKKLENELNQLKANKNSRIAIDMTIDDFRTDYVREAYKTMIELHDAWWKQVTVLKEKMEKELNEKYSPFSYKVETSERIKERNSHYKGTVYLKDPVF